MVGPGSVYILGGWALPKCWDLAAKLLPLTTPWLWCNNQGHINSRSCIIIFRYFNKIKMDAETWTCTLCIGQWCISVIHVNDTLKSGSVMWILKIDRQDHPLVTENKFWLGGKCLEMVKSTSFWLSFGGSDITYVHVAY